MKKADCVKSHTAGIYKMFRKPFAVALVALLLLTIILAVALHLAEKGKGTPGFESWWDSFVWVALYYIGNPGKIVQYEPVTCTGHTVAVMTGIVKLLLFAVVTGYLITMIKKWLRHWHIKDCSEKIVKHFRRRSSRFFSPKVVRPYESVVSIEARLGMDENDIIDAVKQSPVLRLRNLADGELRVEHPNDRLVIERFPVLDTDYGCCSVDRHSKVTIVCPTAVSEAGIGNLSWYVAQLCGFNYISREVRLPDEEDVSFYNYKDKPLYPGQEKFLAEIKRLAPSKNHWTVVMIASVDTDPKCHFVYGAEQDDSTYNSPNITASDTATLDKLLKGVDSALAPNGVTCVWSGRKSGEHSLERIAGKHSEALTLRLSYKTMLWHNDRMEIAQNITEAIANSLSLSTNSKWSDEEADGYGYMEQR